MYGNVDEGTTFAEGKSPLHLSDFIDSKPQGIFAFIAVIDPRPCSSVSNGCWEAFGYCIGPRKVEFGQRSHAREVGFIGRIPLNIRTGDDFGS